MSDIETGRLAASMSSVNPADVVMSPDGSKLYVSGEDGNVRVYDVATRALIATWDVGVRLGGLDVSADGSFLMVVEKQIVAYEPSGPQADAKTTITIYRVDTASGQVTSFPLTISDSIQDGPGPFHDVVMLANGTALISHERSGHPLRILDISNGSYSYQYRPFMASFGAESVLMPSRDRGEALVSSKVSTAPLHIWEAGQGITHSSEVDQSAGAGNGYPDGLLAYSEEANLVVQHLYSFLAFIPRTITNLHVYNGALEHQLDLVTLYPQWADGRIAGLAFDATGANLFVLDEEANQIVQLRTSDWSIVRTFDVGTDVLGPADGDFGNRLLISPDGRYFTVVTGAGLQLVENDGLANAFTGTDAADNLHAGAGDDLVDGVGGNDTLSGGSGNDSLWGGPGDDSLSGGEGADVLRSGTGSDLVYGGEGNDVLYFGSALGPGDVADGGTGRDALVLQGNVTAVLTDTNLAGIESISIQSGANATFGDTANNFYDYDVTTADGNVAAGQQLIVNAQSLRAGEDFTFDGSAETDGRFLIYGGHGTDNLTGGDGVDVFFFEGQRWTAGDKVDGGAGRDSLVISAGSGLTHIEFVADSFTSIESISVNNRYATDPSQHPSYELVLHNGNVAPGATLIVNGSSIPAGQSVNFDGHAVHDGNLILFGGGGHDVLTGGDGADPIIGGGGQDSLTGAAGADTFRYDSVSDSPAGATDLIGDFLSGTDKVDLSRIDANSLVVGDQAFSWIGASAFSGAAGELRVRDDGGYRYVEGDTNGDGQADFAIAFYAVAAPQVQDDFIL
jgi:Ca2+-binding RTX toxin-like protein